MKHAPHLVRLCRYNSGADRPFQRAALGSNAAASAFCGWQNQERCGSQTAAQSVSRAGFATNHYTAKRMIQFLHLLDIKLEIIKIKS